MNRFNSVEAKSLSVALLDEISIEHLNFLTVLFKFTCSPW